MTDSMGDLDPALLARIDRIIQEGWSRWERFDEEVRQKDFHPFVPANPRVVLEALRPHAAPGVRFLECGSGMGVITVLADLLGFDACGIELDAQLAREAEELARAAGSAARFVTGSFLPEGYRWNRRTRDQRLGTIGEGPSGYLQLGTHLDQFDLVFAYPWSGEESVFLDLMSEYGHPDALLLLYTGNDSVKRYRRGREVG